MRIYKAVGGVSSPTRRVFAGIVCSSITAEIASNTVGERMPKAVRSCSHTNESRDVIVLRSRFVLILARLAIANIQAIILDSAFNYRCDRQAVKIMIKTKKEKAINLILLGLALKYLPLIAVAIFVKNINNLPYILVFLILGLFLLGYTSFIKGCGLYAQSKGYSSSRGWLGLLSIFCLLIILLMPDRRKIFFPLNLSDNSIKTNPFWNINIPELFLLSFVSIGVAFIPFLLLYLLDSLNFNREIEENTDVILTVILFYIFYLFILITKLQESGLKYTNFINFKNKIAWKLILFVAVLELTFSESLNSLVLYNLSFIFPSYVEEHLNETNFTNILEIMLWSCSIIVL